MSNHRTPRSRRRSTRLVGTALAGLAAVALPTIMSIAPAGADAAPAATPAKVTKSYSVVAAATTDLVIFNTGVVHDDNGNTINGGQPVEAAAGCTAFTVGSDGYLATAGHCVDPAEGVDMVLEQAVQIEVAAGTWNHSDGTPATSDEMLAYASKHWSVNVSQDVRVHVPAVAGHVNGANDHNYISARVVDFKSHTEGDVSLLKIEASHLPILEVADTSQVREGLDVTSVGFASATSDLTDPGAPSYKDGKISSIRTMEGGKLPVYETSAALNPGMSGGPTVDPDGRVLGVNSFHDRDAQSFNFIMPASLLTEMLKRNGVNNALSPADQSYRDGIDAMNKGDAATADAKFKDVLKAWPELPQAKQLEQDAAAAAVSSPKASTSAAGAVTASTNPTVALASTTSPVATTSSDGLPIGALVALPLAMIVTGGGVFLLMRKSGNRPAAPVGPVAQVAPVAPYGAAPYATAATTAPVYAPVYAPADATIAPYAAPMPAPMGSGPTVLSTWSPADAERRTDELHDRRPVNH